MDKNNSTVGQDDAEQELPSMSQFYQFFHPVVESDMPLSTLSTEVRNVSLHNSNEYSIDNKRHLPTLKNDSSVPGVYENSKVRTLATKTKGHQYALDVELLAEEYARMLSKARENDQLIKQNEIRLDMQDKELEAVIADIAQLCELNVTLTRDMRQTKKYKDYLKEKARECRIEYLCYDTGALMLAAENDELKVEIEKLKNEIDVTKDSNKNRELNLEETLTEELATLKTQIKSEVARNDKLEEKVKLLKGTYDFMQRTVSWLDDGESCSARLHEIYECPKKADIVVEISHNATKASQDSSFNTYIMYDKLTPISPSTPKEQNNPSKSSVVETSVSFTSSCFTSSSKVSHDGLLDDNTQQICVSVDAMTETEGTCAGPTSVSDSPE